MTQFVNNDVASGNVIYASDHNEQGSRIAAAVNNIETAQLADSLIATAKIADSAVTPAKLVAGTGSSWVWQSWTPTWTNLTTGNGTFTAAYIQTGKQVRCRIKGVLGSTSSVSTAPTFTLPVTASSFYTSNAESNVVGAGYASDTGASDSNIGVAITNSTTVAQLRTLKTDATYGQWVTISSTVPISWGNTDTFSCTFEYEAA
jgi:hypothetical protein